MAAQQLLHVFGDPEEFSAEARVRLELHKDVDIGIWTGVAPGIRAEDGHFPDLVPAADLRDLVVGQLESGG